jgi:hypothetical protein
MTDKPFGVNITLLPTINPPDYEGFARAAVAEGVRIFETAGNNRSSSLTPRWFVGMMADNFWDWRAQRRN